MFRLLSNVSIGWRIGGGATLVLVALVALIVPTLLSKLSQVVHEAQQRELRGYYDTITAAIEAEGRLATGLSSLVAAMPEVQQAMGAGDRERLMAILGPTFAVMQSEYGAEQFQFHTPPAMSFLRVHQPARFGDDLSSFRHTIVQTNNSREPVRGLERGVAGLGMRGVVPVREGSRHIGSVEFGMSFGQSFFDRFKQRYGADVALHIPEQGAFKPFATTFGAQGVMSEAQLRRALDGAEVLADGRHNGRDVAVLARTVNDFQGKPVGVLELAVDRSYYASAIASGYQLGLGIAVGALLLGLLMAWVITHSLVRPLKGAVRAMQDIAEGEGDLTRRLPVEGKDEIAQLATAFNNFAEKIRGTVARVENSSTQLAAASEEMAQIARETSAGISAQQGETQQVAAAMNELAASAQEVARSAGIAADAAARADKEADVGMAVVKSAIASMRDLANEVERAGDVVQRLETGSTEIGGVLDVIKNVAEQTNLLALNAAIEAARAGEQGRGFAVVADEVRTLASRTQKSTQEIQAMIERLQKGARDAVEVMSEGRERAGATVEKAGQAGASLEGIGRAVAEISQMNAQIASAAEEQTAVVEEISRNLTNISAASEQAGAGAKQTASASDELARLASGMQGEVRQFKV